MNFPQSVMAHIYAKSAPVNAPERAKQALPRMLHFTLPGRLPWQKPASARKNASTIYWLSPRAHIVVRTDAAPINLQLIQFKVYKYIFIGLHTAIKQ